MRNKTPHPHATRAMNTFLRTLADRAKALKSLVVEWGNAETVSRQFKEGLMDVYEAGDHHLESLHLLSPGCVDTESFILISKLKNLTTLYLNLETISEETQLQRYMTTQTDAFPALKFAFLSGRLEDLTVVIRNFIGNSSQLLNLAFSVKEYPTNRGLRNLLQIVASRFANLNMIQFTIANEDMTAGEMANANQLYAQNFVEYAIKIDALAPILALRSLASVIIEIGIPLALSDADLHTIAEAWPKIEILVLGSDPFCIHTRTIAPTAGIQGLLSLITHCPLLQRVALFLDFTSHVTPELIATCSLLTHSVMQLDVGRSWIEESAVVAALFSGVFPNLREFAWSGKKNPRSWMDGSHGHSASWKEVETLLPVFTATRMNEQKRLV
jgi:hypothetical protein